MRAANPRFCHRKLHSSSIHFVWTRSLSLQHYHDPTLSWAQANPEVAQQCLQPPAWDKSACDESFAYHLGESLEGYCRWRRWPHSSPKSELHERALAISSHVLSAPLTLASFRAVVEKSDYSTERLCCVGARAEATIPVDFWKEYLLLSSALSGWPTQTSLDFVGPDISPRTLNQTVDLAKEKSSLDLQWYYQGFLHDLLAKRPQEKWDAYVFFNPGFGHLNLKDGWHDTLEWVIRQEGPLLLTAHSERDADRDAEHLRKYGLKAEHKENPFASQITYQDPFDKSHIVRPNHFYAHVLP